MDNKLYKIHGTYNKIKKISIIMHVPSSSPTKMCIKFTGTGYKAPYDSGVHRLL
jgi:hypothetical protein